MPISDLRIHDNRLPQITKMKGISVRNDVLYTNNKGEESGGIQKRSDKGLQKLQPALQRVLVPDEAVLYLAWAYIRDFIPAKRDPARAPQELAMPVNRR